MSKEHQIRAKIAEKQRKKQEAARRKAAEEARKRAEAAKRKAEAAQRKILNTLQNQSKQLAAEKAKLTSLVDWKNQIGNQINSELKKVAQTKSELNQLSTLISDSQNQLDKLISHEKNLHQQINTLIVECTATKEEAINTQKIWKSELSTAEANLKEINPLFERANQLSKGVHSAINQTNGIIQNLERQEEQTSRSFVEIEKQTAEYNKAVQTLSFIDTNQSLATSAFVTLQALENSKYQLREAVSDEELTAWFEKVDSKGNKKEVFVKLSKAFYEAEEWLEELDISKGFVGDECIDEEEDILEEMEKLGVKYKVTSSKYPLPPKSIESEWQKRLRNNYSNRQKLKN